MTNKEWGKTYIRLVNQLDDEPEEKTTLLILADLLEDKADYHSAEGLRLLHEKGVKPFYRHDVFIQPFYWAWWNITVMRLLVGGRKYACIPSPLFTRMNNQIPLERNTGWQADQIRLYEKRSHAIMEFAFAYGRWKLALPHAEKLVWPNDESK